MSLHTQMIVPADHQSIFGDTYRGVPSPMVPHTHPYPTRYHGPIWTYPRFDMPYQPQSWQSARPMPACASCSAGVSGISGDDKPALFGTATGNSWVDAALGAAIGYVGAHNDKDRLLWAAGGAFAGKIAGTLGLLGTLGLAIYTRSK